MSDVVQKPRGMDRRTLLKAGGAALAVGALLPPLGEARATQRAQVDRLEDDLHLVSGVGCNVLALSTPEGVTLVDCGAPDYTAVLLRELRDLPGGKRVQRLINTHWHPEQTGANEALGRSGTQIIAHEKTRLWLATDHYLPLEDRYERARPRAAQPSQAFYTTGSLGAGDERLEYGYLLEAHTAGDCYVFCRAANVLAVGHAASPTRDPELDWYAGGWIGGRLDALALLVKLSDERTRIVPAFGPVMTRAQLQAELDLWQEVYNRSLEHLRKGFSHQDMLAAGIMNGLARTWADPQAFMYSVCKGLWAHHNMLTHDIV